MKRTQIYLTEEQDRAIARVATARRCSKAEVVRQVLDAAFDTGDVEADARAVITGTAGLCADYPDWPEWLASVRGHTADERLGELGL
jgi:hypothetical protein